MRNKIVAGNWKMNLHHAEALALSKAIREGFSSDQKTKVILAPSFVYLLELLKLNKDSGISIAAQNCSDKNSGAFTGEVSAPMLSSIGVEYVIIGHSERRKFYYEDNQLLAKKVSTALNYRLTPIFCCGETEEQRNENKQLPVVKEQVEVALFQLSAAELNQCIIAYEPVWAIGTGKHATPEQAQEMHQFIRNLINEKYGNEIAESTTILYGGSVTPENAGSLFSCKDVDGALVGGASLKSTDFLQIIQSMENLLK